ncbi:DUF1826 domain-containing protein [Pseudomonas fluorescens]|uniref:DUF1826 domain-containing protein n=1 Tax=Pseudomonas fluorescens TaxID=294 RepID=UPI00177FC6B0|nr:DUF1826 domain-containing protein [Pseudomonas fluorescens]MBD8096862.1 DUF1826 domain-containing protein [Pseudomonas fluorescens]MBD8776060.1 DUF1826 domain-containing protein [Pseudomonas fluorescens]MBD8780658.1 DUF1826 domain-containing protein [Pseudomonas fluorescens]MBD8797359.1 DUF1826 domain-containing protein [Pseudomonas fluorescens]
MLASVIPLRPVIRQTSGETPLALSDILEDGVNLALWQRQLPLHIAEFGALLVALDEPLAEALVIELSDDDTAPNLQGLASGCRDLEGYDGFIADVSWLVSAFACLLGARRIGVRLRLLDKAMCPRFHVDHVPVRLITTYAGVGSQWLREGVMDRRRLSQPDAEPSERIEHIHCGEVALLKGTKWHGNEHHGLIHRSPALKANERRLILTLDWLA